MIQKYIFHVNGMHCKACVALIESELLDVPEVSQAKSSLANLSVEVAGDFGDKTAEHVARDLSEVLKSHGYTLYLKRQRHRVEWREFNIAVPLALGFIVLFIVLQKLGLVNLITASSDVSYGTAFVVGLIASVSTCMAVVGGLVLSMSANFAKEGDPSSTSSLRSSDYGASKVKPILFFHAGRLVSFFVLGGVVGTLGGMFELGATGTFILSFAVGLVLLILGVNLLDVFPWAKKLQPTLPKFIGKHIHDLKSINHTLTPILVGVATFFLPCGFTQSMQIYTLTTGSFWTGAFIMSAFALGTLPVLALLSFSSLGIHKKAQSGVFFKTAGLVVIFFGVLNLVNSLVAVGVIAPVFNL